jgi:hypothetical protein
MPAGLARFAAAAVLVGFCFSVTTAAAAYAIRRPDLRLLDTSTESQIHADYSRDPDGIVIPPLDPAIIDAADKDDLALVVEQDAPPERVDVAHEPTPTPPPATATATVPATVTRTPLATSTPVASRTPAATTTAPPATASAVPQTPAPATAIPPHTATAAPRPTDTPAIKPTATRAIETPAPFITPTFTPSRTPSATPTRTHTPQPADTEPVPTATASPTDTPTATPSFTPTPTPTPSDTPVPTPTATSTSTPTPTATPTPAGTAETVVLMAEADTYIGPGNPAQNHGSETLLHIDAAGSSAERSLLLFNVDSGIPGDATVQSATLTICMQNLLAAAAGRTHVLHLVTSPWTELGATWNSIPTFSASSTDTITVPLLVGCVDFDVTADVQGWIDDDENNGWLLKDQSESAAGLAGVEYASREHGTPSQRPSLSVTFIP